MANKENLKAYRWQRVIAEFLGTLLFIYAVSSSVVIPTAYLGAPSGVTTLVTAFIQGMALVAVIAIFAGISGSHFNPAITFMTMMTRRIAISLGIAYIFAQMLGAVVGAALFRLSVDRWHQGNLSATTVGEDVSKGQAVLIEFMITTLLLLVVLGTSTDSRQGLYILAPVPIGFSVLVGVLVARTLTGASMNPARSFGPAVVSGVWNNHWIYWVGPFLSSVVVSFLSYVLFTVKEPVIANLPHAPNQGLQGLAAEV